MIQLTINGRRVSAQEGATIIEVAKQNGIQIPNLCWMEGVHKLGACRICVVEVEGAKTLQASCITQAREGMVIKTNSDRVRRARRVLYELLLSDHNQDCLNCKRNLSCELQQLGKTLGIEQTRFEGEHSKTQLDASVSITRDMSKCVLCRRCVTACGEIQGVGILKAQNRGFDTMIGPAMALPIGEVNCSFCGQCTVVCPVGALRETDGTARVWKALSNPKKRVAAQVAPAVRVAIGEEFGMPPGSRVTGKLAAALRHLGFDDVFDTNFTADLTIMEEGTELINRLKAAFDGAPVSLPMITSCSPGWIKYVEHTFPDQLDHLSTCKSPHTMLGALVKSYYAEKIGVDPDDMYVVSVMPCTAKKFEIERPEMKNGGRPNVDAVITTRELAAMIKEAGIDFVNLPDESFDNPLGLSTGAADIFGLSGGVMEAALRTVYELVTGRELPFAGLHVTPVIGLDKVKQAEVVIENAVAEYAYLEGAVLRVAVTSGLSGARELMEQIQNGASPYHFIEVMGCPGGCITGGGQPRSDDSEIRAKRLRGLLDEDEAKPLRKSHENPYIAALYSEYLKHPNGHLSHELLHTHYVRRGGFNELSQERYVIDAVKPKSKHVDTGGAASSARPSGKIAREGVESVRLLELEAENQRLKSELNEALETVDIFKQVVADYADKRTK